MGIVSEVAPSSEHRSTRTLYRWDLDKTYLSTDFDSLGGLLRAAVEKAADKRTFPGARALLRELCATEPCGLYILSGSPQQMRPVIEEKLKLDGIRWDGLVLKPSLNRLLRGRFRFLRDQVSYKLTALLSSRLSLPSACDEVMFGDDAEADAFVYSLYVDLCAGRAGLDLLARVLELSRAYDDDAARVLELARGVPRVELGGRIFIHLERVEPSSVFSGFGPRVCAFHNYFQPALVLVEDGLLGADAAMRVGLELVHEHAFSPDALAASYGDLVRRGLLSARAGASLGEAAEALQPSFAGERALSAFLRTQRSLSLPERAIQPRLEEDLDYLTLFPTDKARAIRAKTRARARKMR